MSAETKKDAEYASEFLKKGAEHLKTAEKYANASGDKTMTTKITKVKEATQEISKEIDHRISET